ncbi:hypothetical protein WICMUC_005892 [Wickerhamomyces mucosus]|uniref:Metal resistance protein YCF1 n=1 Tax=Wickerhamomyces mucosus TaxID=1378264 RepID=A0A9P8P2A7_9ASCO|nr:hypothetical protein WICMUC_005892 [Wickerhamomyces mucosus]
MSIPFHLLNQDKLNQVFNQFDQHDFTKNSTESSIISINSTQSHCRYLCNDLEGWGPISSNYSDFTRCFINGGIFSFINLFLLILGLYQIYKIKQQITKNSIKFKQNWIYPSRLLIVIGQFILSILTIFNVFYNNYNDTINVDIIQPILQSFALIVGFFLHHYDYFYSKVTNSILLTYWFLTSIFGLIKIFHLNLRGEYKDDYFILSIFTFIISIFGLLISWLPNKPKQQYQSIERKNPQEDADLFALLTFSWMTPLMKLGYSTFLTEKDLPPLPENFKSSKISQKFEINWNKQLIKTNPSLGWAIIQTFGSKILLGGIFKIIQDILQFAQPQLLRYLIKFVNTYNSNEPEPISKGFVIVFAMFICSVVQTTSLHQYFWNLFNVGINIKSSMIAIIYKKSLKLSPEEKSQRATGDVVNLMSVDTQRLQDLTSWGTIIYSGPFQLIICLYSLYDLLGNSMWVGIILMIILIPINSLIMATMKSLQKIQMKNKDERTRVISEILNNIKSLKLYGWETPYKEKLNYVRNEKELKNLRKMNLVQAIASFQFNVAPFLVSCSTFATFVYTQDRPLSSDLVFPALTLFNLLSFPLAVIPMAIASWVEAQVAIGRLSSFLTSDELQTDAVTFLPKGENKGDDSVKVTKGTFLWQRKPDYKVALANVNFLAKKGDLACIVGKVGSGKSALIQSILGDLRRIDGSVTIHGNIAYVAQVPWIMNGTVKENIIFGHKFDPIFYEKTVKACALTIDFAILKDGDQTLVGEKGISLSGGQKARISLARAVYARADVYLLDDPLAAVDEHVGKHLVDHVLGPRGLLSSKTKILSTNKISVLSIADSITLLKDGVIAEQGTYSEVVNDPKSSLRQLIEEFGSKKEAVEEEFEESQINVDDLISSEEGSDADISDALSLRRASFSTLRSIRFDDDAKDNNREHREQGKVKWDIYLEYAKACNPKYVIIFLISVSLPQLLSVASNVWLKHWSEVNSEKGYNPDVVKYLSVYLVLGVGASASILLQSIILFQFCSVEASTVLHSRMINSVLRAPMQFFETTPIGRILNRFSNDIYKIDEVLARTFSNFLVNCTKVGFTIFVICFSTWQFIIFIIPILYLYLYYQQYYMRTSRELRRLDSVTRSPVYAHFQESLGGSSTIRGFHQTKRFEHINQSRVDNNISAYFPSINANRWLAVRLEFLGSLIILAAAGFSILTLLQGGISSGLVGLSVSYSLQITQALNWIIRMTVEVETNIVSVERVKEYSELTSEAAEFLEPRPDKSWPQRGEIEFKNYSTRYRADLDLVLKSINIKINPKEKIGIVGRTGAGKSSLTLALYRIIEAAEGEIVIDGIPTHQVGLQDLRHSLSIIPQDSQVFEGTIRENIDPTNQFTDDQIWKALELSHLKDHISTMEDEDNKGLNVKLSEGGSNLSVGQRQLMCLARALLIPSKILVLDEATAAVDVETDKILQETIRSEFKDRTILTIAHRLNTIMDSDKIIVLDKGEVKEFDSPENLLKNQNGIFYSLVNAGNEQE